jgi:AhpD family alkylhydroperoxidase
MAQHATAPDSWIAERLQGPQQRFKEFARKVYAGGALDLKTKELIAMAVSSMLRCRHCTRSHIEAAFKTGASKAEVAETLAVLWVIGSGVQVVWNQEGFEAHLREHVHA